MQTLSKIKTKDICRVFFSCSSINTQPHSSKTRLPPKYYPILDYPILSYMNRNPSSANSENNLCCTAIHPHFLIKSKTKTNSHSDVQVTCCACWIHFGQENIGPTCSKLTTHTVVSSAKPHLLIQIFPKTVINQISDKNWREKDKKKFYWSISTKERTVVSTKIRKISTT